MKRISACLAVFIGALFLFFSCKSGEIESEQIQFEIQKVNKAFSEAIRAGDAAKVAAFYARDAQLLPPNSDIISGQTNIEAFWKGILQTGVKGVKLETLEIAGTHDMAHEIGKFTILGENEQVLDSGKYIVLWMLEDGKWKLHRDIWNSSQPAEKEDSSS